MGKQKKLTHMIELRDSDRYWPWSSTFGRKPDILQKRYKFLIVYLATARRSADILLPERMVDTSTQYPTIINWLTMFRTAHDVHAFCCPSFSHFDSSGFHACSVLDFTYTRPAIHTPRPRHSLRRAFTDFRPNTRNVTDKLALMKLCFSIHHSRQLPLPRIVSTTRCHKFFGGQTVKALK